VNCTYSNYTEAAATRSAAQQQITLLYKYCTNCTTCNWTLLTVIKPKLLLHVQLHNSTEYAKLMSSDVDSRLFLILYFYMEGHVWRLDTSNSRNWLANVTWRFYGATRCFYDKRHTVQTEGNINICFRNGMCLKLVWILSNVTVNYL